MHCRVKRTDWLRSAFIVQIKQLCMEGLPLFLLCSSNPDVGN